MLRHNELTMDVYVRLMIGIGVILTGIGLFQSIHTIFEEQYISYGMVHISALTLVDRLNPGAAILIPALLYLLTKVRIHWLVRASLAVWLTLAGTVYALKLFTNHASLKKLIHNLPGNETEFSLRPLLGWLSVNDIAVVYVLVVFISAPIVFFALIRRFSSETIRTVLHSSHKGSFVTLISVMLGFLLILNGGLGGSFAFFKAETPNIILIVVDTLRFDHLGISGYPRPVSPNIDRFATDSKVFTHARSTASWTSPSIAAMFTSRYPATLEIRNMKALRLDRRFLCLAEILKDRFYGTHAIVSHRFIDSEMGFHQGFDWMDEENCRGHLHISSESVTQKACAFLNKQHSKPFFLFLHYFDPHYRFRLHEQYDYYPQYSGDIPRDGNISIEALREKAPGNPDDLTYIKALYDSEIRYTDHHLGVLMRTLKALNLYDDALIILTADHGEYFNEKADPWIGHAKILYQEVLHVPLLVKLPEESGNRLIPMPMSTIDLLPGVLHAAGLKQPVNFMPEGRVWDLSGVRWEPRTFCAYTELFQNAYSVERPPWKCLWFPDTGNVELYNLEADPGELENLASRYPERTAELRTELDRWIEETIHGRTDTGVESDYHFSSREMEELRALGYVE